MKKWVIGFILTFAILTFFTLQRKIYFPTDILSYLPSFSSHSWERAHNSLLADPVYQFEPWRNFAKLSFSSGVLPIWNDHNASGVPFLANIQASVFHPFQILYYLLPLTLALNLIPVLKLFFLGLFTYIYLRTLSLSRASSFIGLIFVTFAAFPMTWLLWPHVTVFMLFPLLLLIIEKYRSGKISARHSYLLISISYFLLILGGHPGTIFHASLITIAYSIVRLYKVHSLKTVFLGFLSGFLLSSFQVFPFVEYLLNSSAADKFGASQIVYLPLKTAILNIVPFLLGAPHTEFYKQISAGLNFQELSSGYIGVIAIGLSIYGAINYFRNNVVRFWVVIVAVTFLSAYGVWPFSLFFKLPPINAIANTRIIAFGAFGIGVIAALAIDQLFSVKLIQKKLLKNISIIIIAILVIYFSTEEFISLQLMNFIPEKLALFMPYLKNHLLLIFTSTSFFIVLIFYLLKKSPINRFPLFFLLFIPILVQNIFLFVNYNKLHAAQNYYPNSDLTRKLQSLPIGSILEVGNPNLPPNINLIYNLKSAQNDDAIGVKNYNSSFNKFFPNKNHWGKVDEINQNALNKFGIYYVVSDYDINLKKSNIQPLHSTLTKLEQNKKITFELTDYEDKLEQIRLLTANFNRLNSCTFQVRIMHESLELGKSIVECNRVRDNMYYTLTFPAITLIKGNKYIVEIATDNSTQGNSIGIWGSKDGKPYVDALYNAVKPAYTKQFQDGSVYLYSVPDSEYISFDGEKKVVLDTETKTIVSTKSDKAGRFEIKRVRYPFWTLKIDGKKTELENYVFMRVKVPPGSHLLEIIYTPVVFYIGSLISIMTVVWLLCYFIRGDERVVNVFINKFNLKKYKTVPWDYQLKAIAGGLSTGIFIIVFFSKFLNIQFKLPFSTAINWYTLNKYPRQSDFFYVFMEVVILMVSAMLVWLICLKKYKQK